MTSPISGLLGWTVIGYVTIVGAGRLLFTRDAIFDQLVNRALLWGLLGLVLYRCTPTLSITSVPNLLALGCSSMVVMHLYGLARLWESDADPATTWRRQRIYCAVAAISTVLTLFAGRLAGRHPDWGELVVWTAHCAPLVATTLVHTRLCLRELRTESPRPFAKAMFSLMLLAYAPIYPHIALLVGELAYGWKLQYPVIVRSEISFTFATVLATTLVAVPMIGHLMERVGLDRDGRICRRLGPLWRDVTAAVPEIVMSPGGDGPTRHDTTARLLRMTVEIRDALLHLGPYLPPHTRDGLDEELGVYACRLADAARARQAGRPPTTSTPMPQTFLTATDFDTELQQLLDLARVWPAPGSR